MVRIKNALIFYKLLPHFGHRHLVTIIVVGVLPLLLESQIRRLVVEIVGCRRLVVVGSNVPSCGCVFRILRLVDVVFVVGYFIVGGLFLLSLSSSSCRQCHFCWVSYRQRRLVFVVVIGLLSSSSLAASCRCRWRWRRGIL